MNYSARIGAVRASLIYEHGRLYNVRCISLNRSGSNGKPLGLGFLGASSSLALFRVVPGLNAPVNQFFACGVETGRQFLPFPLGGGAGTANDAA